MLVYGPRLTFKESTKGKFEKELAYHASLVANISLITIKQISSLFDTHDWFNRVTNETSLEGRRFAKD